jgi:histidine phosphotransferase ChpT
MDDLDVAAMLCSLMCHDLVSPVGALVNGVEILEEEEDKKIQDQALGLLSHSAEEASHRLQFFRLAFGASGGLGAQIHLGDAERVLTGLLMNGRIKLKWAAPTRSLDKTIVKLALNMAFAGVESLGRGGSVDVDVALEGEPNSSDVLVTIMVNGEGARFKENCKELLTGEAAEDELTTRSVQPYYTQRLAEGLGATIVIDDSKADCITISTRVTNVDLN